MTAKEYILSKRVPKLNDCTIVLADGVECRFEIPLNGVGKSSLERRVQRFAKDKPNGVWVAKGLMPAEGFDESVATGLAYIAYTNQEGWSMETVLELFDANPNEILAVFTKLMVQASEDTEIEDKDEELKN